MRALGTSSPPRNDRLPYPADATMLFLYSTEHAALGIRGGLFFSLVKVRVADFGSILVARVGRD